MKENERMPESENPQEILTRLLGRPPNDFVGGTLSSTESTSDSLDETIYIQARMITSIELHGSIISIQVNKGSGFNTHIDYTTITMPPNGSVMLSNPYVGTATIKPKREPMVDTSDIKGKINPLLN